LLTNIAFINPRTNKRLRDEPYIYISKFNTDKDELKRQLIPVDDESIWRLSNYDAFIEKSSAIISDSINSYLTDLYPDFYQNSIP
jgi:hypothetical protein